MKSLKFKTVAEYLVKDLIPNPRNPKIHTDEQIEVIKESIQQYGFNCPILIKEGGFIIAGHGRKLALDGLGIEKVEVKEYSKTLTDKEANLLMLLDNHTNSLTGDDYDKKAAILMELAESGVNLEALAFDFDPETFKGISSGEIGSKELETDLKITFKFDSVEDFEFVNGALNQLGNNRTQVLVDLLNNA